MTSSVGKARLQPRHQLEAVEIGHPDVDNREVRAGTRAASDSASRDEPRADHLMVVAQHALDGAQHARFVVHDEDARRSHDHCALRLRHRLRNARRGRRVPLPGSL